METITINILEENTSISVVVTELVEEITINISELGTKGDKGDTGDTGPQGVQGIKGDTGDQGLQGIQGIKGDTGDQGPQGIQGIKGDTGDQGPQGIQGIKGDTGDQGPQGIQGIKGDTGDTGPQGIQGIKGDTGDTGPQGIQGIKGDTGDTGPQGIQGIKGDTGDTGPQGIQGIKGDTGDTGPQGIQGLPGTNGANSNIYFADAVSTDINIANASLVSVISKSLVGLAVGDTVEVEIFGNILNNSTANRTYLHRIQLGASIISITDGTTIAFSATNESVHYIKATISIISASSVYLHMELRRGTPGAINTGQSIAVTTVRLAWNNTANNETGTKTIEYLCSGQNATTTQTFKLRSYKISVIKRL
jgi:hypothetical protein